MSQMVGKQRRGVLALLACIAAGALVAPVRTAWAQGTAPSSPG